MMLIQAGVGVKLHEMVYAGVGVVAGFTCTIEAAYMDYNALDPEAEGDFGYSKLDVNAELEMAPVFGLILMHVGIKSSVGDEAAGMAVSQHDITLGVVDCFFPGMVQQHAVNRYLTGLIKCH